MKRAIPVFLGIAMAVFPLAAARAQQQGGQLPTASDPCQVTPGKGDTPPPETGGHLDRCKGVLKPPSNTDNGIEKQPPQQGETPVIPPEQLPQQQKPQ